MTKLQMAFPMENVIRFKKLAAVFVDGDSERGVDDDVGGGCEDDNVERTAEIY